MLVVTEIAANDDLQRLVAEINQAVWDDANDMSEFSLEALRTYLERPDTLFVACHDVVEGNRTLLGIASSRLEMKPYDEALWLYVDEVDVCADQRRRGAGKAIMQKLIACARNAGCEEVWLGTEPDNQAANALYQSLEPDEIESFVGYTYVTRD